MRECRPSEYSVRPGVLVRVLPVPDVIDIVVCDDPRGKRVVVPRSGHVSPASKRSELLDRRQ